jgi:TonB family protein
MNTERNVVMAIGMIEETIAVVNDGTPPPALPTYQRRPISPPRTPTVQGMGGNLRPPRKLRHVAPIYPASGAEGVVILTAVIGLDGTVTNTRPLSASDPDLAQAAIDAVNLWDFDPTRLDGIPVETLMQVTVSYSAAR